VPASIPKAELEDDERHVAALDTAGISETHCIESVDGERRVLKVLRLAEVDRWKAVELFEREAKALQRLDHPEIPTYLDFRTDVQESDTPEGSGSVTLTARREWIPGESLQTRLETSHPEPALDAAELGNFLHDALEILGYLHGQNPPVVHRDVTPEHFIVTPDDDLTLVGFGGLQAILPQTRGGSTFVGTRGYMAVEQMMGRAVPASDLYGLAATAVHLVTGDHPGDLLRTEGDENLRARLQKAGVSQGHIALLVSMLRPEPGDRPPDAKAAARRLEKTTDLTRASDIELALIDEPTPEAVDARVPEDTESEPVSVTVPKEGYTTKQWWLTVAGIVIGLGFMGNYALHGAWIVTAALGVVFAWSGYKVVDATWGDNELELDGPKLVTKNRLARSSEWDLESADSITWDRDDGDRSYYQVQIEIDGTTHTVASRLNRPRAVWLTDFLQRLRTRRLPDDTRSL